MSETTNQMSLLDAIGFSAPEATEKQKKDKPAKAEKSEKKQRKKAAAKPEAEAASGAESNDTREAEIDVAVAETPVSQEIADTGETPDVSAETQAGEDPGTEQAASASAANHPASNQDDDSQKIHDGSLPLDRHLCFALYSANHAMHGVYKALLKEVGLTYPQFLAMTVLWETNNVPVGAITSKLQLDTNTLTPLLKRLEAMGLVTRTRNIKDERQVILKLTRKGRALQKKTEHFSTCIMSSTGLKLEEVIDLQAKVMTLRDNLRKAGLE